jgi:hypothetical protein
MAARGGVHLVSRAEMARRLRIDRSQVTRACRPGGRLERACKGLEVNCLHPAARRWIAERDDLRASVDAELDAELESAAAPPANDDPGSPAGDGANAGAPPAPPAPEQLPMPWQVAHWNLSELEQPLTLLTERYGAAEPFTQWVKARKALEEARRHEMLRERVAGKLIARTTVVLMLGHVDAAFRLLLSDTPRAIATRLGVSDVATATRMIRDAMSQHLEAAQTHMLAALDADDPSAPLMEAAQ